MNGRLTFLHCVCLTLAGVLVLALAQGLSGIPPENASARDKGQVKSASRLVTSPVNQVGRQIRNEGGVAVNATINFRWLDAQVGSYPSGTSGQNSADLVIPGAQSDGQPLWLAIYYAGWGDQAAFGGRLKTIQAQMDASSLTPGLAPWRPFCADDDDDNNDPDPADEACFALMGTGTGAGCDVMPIDANECAPAFQDFTRPDAQTWGVPGCNIASDNLKCGGVVGAEPNHIDPGTEVYLGTLVLLLEQSVVGDSSIEFIPPGPNTHMNDGLTTIKVNTATLSIASGSCCFGIGGPAGTQCVEGVSAKDCAGRAPATSFRPDPPGGKSRCPGNGGPDCKECFQDSDCADPIPGITTDNRCTDDTCGGNCICQHTDIPGWDRDDDCCDPRNGNLSGKDDGVPCTIDTCSDGGDFGTPVHSPAPPGSPCDDGGECTYDDVCDDQGGCVGTDINNDTCSTNEDCDALIPNIPCCDGFCGCFGLFSGCCLPDGSCELPQCPGDCEASGGTLLDLFMTCQGDRNGNGLDDACEVNCCLGRTCRPELPQQCFDLGGTEVPLCLGDGNDNGLDDACEVNCCVGGACRPELPQECIDLGGTEVPLCLGDGDGNGLDDACLVNCCVGNTCGPESPQQCVDLGGTEVLLCVGDSSGNGLDDACEVNCCNGTTCQTFNSPILPQQCTDGGGTLVPFCLGDGNGNGADDACESPIVIPPGDDCWRTECGRTQFSFCNQPIPADFFGTGSLPFAGILKLGGKEGSTFDTSMRRLQEMILDPPPSVDSTPIELVALNLESCQSITVDFSDSTTENWDVEVELSLSGVEPGTLTVTRTHTNGGMFTAEFLVQPVFKFTRVDDPNDVRILDTGALGIPPAPLETFGQAPYVHRLADGSTVVICGTNFAPGVEEDPEEDPETRVQCCRKIGHAAGPPHPTGHIHETAPPAPDCPPCPSGACCNTGNGGCTLAQGAGDCIGDYKGDGTDCRDTDGDGLADVLESASGCGACPTVDLCNLGTDPGRFDTDGDGCSDGEEVSGGKDPCDSCDYLSACVNFAPDCNGNDERDECDIRAGTSDDCNNNNKPDECESGACCGIERDSGLPACVVTTKGQCDALIIPATFRGPCVECPAQKTAIFEEDGVVFIHSNCPPVGCPPEPSGSAAGAHECGPGPFFDAWVSPAVASMCHNFGAAGGGPIPADFFGPGSDPFDGIVCLEGLPLGPTPFGDFGQADTIIERTADPFDDRCDLPTNPPAKVTVDIEIVALSLVSTDPITVTFNGGQNPEQWDAAVDLSEVHTDDDTNDPPIGALTATKTHCNGGIYISSLYVQPRFTFTKVSDPTQELGFDTGTESFDPIKLIQDDPAPWVHDVDPNLSYAGDLCSAFHGGIEEANPTTDCDCNDNEVRDKCEIENETSMDCNENGIPDECDIDKNAEPGTFYCGPDCNGCPYPDCDDDCNDNAIPDGCESDCNNNDVPDDCDVDDSDPDGNGLVSADCNNNTIPDECEDDCNQNGVPDDCDVDDSVPDCNSNGRPDECDIRSGASGDCNENDVPDECDIAAGTLTDLDGNDFPDECQARGACCDPSDGMCEDDFLQSACQPPEVWHNNLTCAELDDQCRVSRGACCDSSPLAGDCRDDVLESDCAGENDKWFRNARCEETDCVANQIPTVSEWGLVILTLLLLTGAKIYFGHRRAPV